MAKKVITVEQIEHALKAKAGNIAAAARDLGVSRSTLNRRIADSPSLRDYVQDVREELVDIAESVLKREVLAGNITAVIFALKTQGKARGYVERLEIDVRYVALVKQIEELANKHGMTAGDLFNDLISELSAADSPAALTAGSSGDPNGVVD